MQIPNSLARYALAVLFCCALSAAPVRLIFDTDMGNDIDDAVALAMIHALESRGEAKLLAVTVTKDNRWSAPFIDVMNTFYGRGNIPIGVVHNGKTPEDSNMIRLPSERKRPDGSFVYPHDLLDGRNAPEAVSLLRQVLAKETDGAVVIVQVGFSTNLARLIETAEGRDLVRRKVRLLSIMGGAFPDGQPEYNIKMDIPAAQKLFAEWPAPIVTSGFEVGETILYPASSIEHDYRYVPDHPLAEAYRDYMKMPYDRPMWDPTAALYAVRPGYFSLSPSGSITVDNAGRTHFTANPQGKHRYLLVSPEQRRRALQAIVELASRPPDRLGKK
ncbi:MAG TPA: nucleoside hydrolase [Bryobacteraceae bacterium]|nr:nucleoside hydrolase [Bryobacteraceae bacterium]